LAALKNEKRKSHRWRRGIARQNRREDVESSVDSGLQDFFLGIGAGLVHHCGHMSHKCAALHSGIE
jgi:hypothetical protein